MFLSHARMLAFAQKFALFKISFHAKVMAYMQVVGAIDNCFNYFGLYFAKGATRWNTPLKVALSFCVTAYFRPKCGVEFNLTKISTINLQGQRCTKVSRKSAYFSLANSIFLNTTFFHLTVMLVQHYESCLPKIRRLKNSLIQRKRDFVFRKSESWADVSSTWRWFYLSKTSMKKDPCPIVSVVACRGKKRAAGPLQNTSPSTFLQDMLLLWIVCSQERFSFERSPIHSPLEAISRFFV